jgi:hypothetical protein
MDRIEFIKDKDRSISSEKKKVFTAQSNPNLKFQTHRKINVPKHVDIIKANKLAISTTFDHIEPMIRGNNYSSTINKNKEASSAVNLRSHAGRASTQSKHYLHPIL